MILLTERAGLSRLAGIDQMCSVRIGSLLRRVYDRWLVWAPFGISARSGGQ
ncbi:MAG: hypothetical protein J2P19_05900 [Pseudonocardia sp.]|nr:hypothetical protein [Pseudonocardia sp.]